MDLDIKNVVENALGECLGWILIGIAGLIFLFFRKKFLQIIEKVYRFIYRAFLHRETDPNGERAYVSILEREGFFGLVRIVQEVKKSEEYLSINK